MFKVELNVGVDLSTSQFSLSAVFLLSNMFLNDCRLFISFGYGRYKVTNHTQIVVFPGLKTGEIASSMSPPHTHTQPGTQTD